MDTQKITPLVLIPAAGFGTRVGQPEAKELLIGTDGKPLIARALEQALNRRWPVHVITRAQKKSLIRYLHDFSSQTGLEVQVQIIEPSREWPETVLQSAAHWRTKNLLVLPDTVYEPLSVWEELVSSKADLAVACFAPADYEKWGVVRMASPAQIEICEKPQVFRDGMRAWGLTCFTLKAGQQLLSSQLESTLDHQWRTLELPTEMIELSSFADVTRGSTAGPSENSR